MYENELVTIIASINENGGFGFEAELHEGFSYTSNIGTVSVADNGAGRLEFSVT